MFKALGMRPGRELRAAQLHETLLKPDGVFSGARISRGNGTTNARVAAFQRDFADVEADHAAELRSEKLVFPKWRNTVDLQRGAETQAGFRNGDAGEPIADGLERSGGDDGGAVGDQIVGDARGIVANHDGLIEVGAEPGCSGLGVSRE